MRKKTVFLFGLILCSFLTHGQDNRMIRWISIEELNKVYKTTPKKILFEVYSKECHYCKDMDENIFSNRELAEYINKTYYAVKLDAFDKRDVNFGGFLYQSKDGINPLASHLLKATIKFPTLIFVDEQLKMINYLQGYNDLARNKMVLHYVGDDAYKTMAWGIYQQEFEPKKE